MIWATVSSLYCFCWLYRAFPSLTEKKIINVISLLTILWCSSVETILMLPEHQKSKSIPKINYICFTDYVKDFDCVDQNKLWKILQETGIPDHLTCLLRNLYGGQEATIRTGCGTTDWFQIRKGVCQGCILSTCLFNLYSDTSREMLGWMKHKLESRLPGEISITIYM